GGEAIVALLLLGVTIGGARQLWPFLVLAALTGATQAVGAPAARSLTPEIVPVDLVAGALALRSVAFQISTVAGPAGGGLLFALQPGAVYATASAPFAVAAVSVLRLTALHDPRPAAEPPPPRASLLRGIRLHPGP